MNKEVIYGDVVVFNDGSLGLVCRDIDWIQIDNKLLYSDDATSVSLIGTNFNHISDYEFDVIDNIFDKDDEDKTD